MGLHSRSTLKMNKIPAAARYTAYGLSALSLFAILSAFVTGKMLLLGVPLFIAGILLAFTYNEVFYYLLWICVPFSFDFSITPSLTLTVATEPLMMLLLAIAIAWIALRKEIDTAFWGHPIMLLLLLHFGWMLCSLFYSVAPALSAKYAAAKLWYYAAFIFIPGFLLKNISDFKKTFWALFGSLFLTILLCLFRHAGYGFSFEGINPAVRPIFPNHVMYSALLGLFIPFVWYAGSLYQKFTLKNYWIWTGMILFLIAIATSYTRTTWLSIPAGLVAVWALRNRLLPVSLIAGAMAIVGVVFYLNHDNKYLDYAPDYQHTVFNKGNFERHLEATYKLEDVSGMERVYRWVAASNMIKAHPVLGTGTNTFYPEYKRYTVTAFKTYLSDNPEHSTTHNYFLLLMAEQGLVGCLLFMAIYVFLLVKAHRIFHTSTNKNLRRLTLATYFSLIVFLVHLMLGDMVESDKTGSIFLFCIALIIKLDIWNTEDQKNLQVSKVISSATN